MPMKRKEEEEDDCKLDEDEEECDVTVAEAEECLNDNLAAMDDAYGSLSCSSDLNAVKEPEKPASCKAIEDKCPALTEEEEETR